MTRILILLLFAGVLVSCKKKKEVMVSPIVSPITEAVFAPGRIEAGEQFTLTANSEGYIKEIYVNEADSVVEGQEVLLLDNATAALQQQTASENLRISEAQAANNSAILQQLYAQLSAAEAKFQNDKMQMERMERLYATSSVARIDLDNAWLALSNSKSNVEAIRKNIEATQLSLQQTLINSRGQQESAKISNSYYTVKSPGSFIVYSLLKKKAELARKGEAIAVLGKAGAMKAVLSVDETSIAKIKIGQLVLVGLNTDKQKTYKGTVSKILPLFDVASQAYTVELRFDQPIPDLINGTLLQANIIVATNDQAMLIPREYFGADGKVWVKRSRLTDTLTIRTGILSTEWVEVLDGLDLEDKLIKRY